MENVKISSPWITYYHKIKAMFIDDPNIDIVFDEDQNLIKMYVKGHEKAEALTLLLPPEKDFGGVKVKLSVIPANVHTDKADLLMIALDSNPNFAYLQRVDVGSANKYNYAVFAKKVCQYWNDNLGDPHGNVSCLYEDLAKDIFGTNLGVMYCTDKDEGF